MSNNPETALYEGVHEVLRACKALSNRENVTELEALEGIKSGIGIFISDHDTPANVLPGVSELVKCVIMAEEALTT